jgi:hypothetical protein
MDFNRRRIIFVLSFLLAGCGTTRMTDTQRTATEQLLVSNAVDQAVSQLDFKHLAGKPVFFDAQYLDGVVDRGYLISSLRQHLLASGCLLQEERAKADYVVEARSGGVGTNRNSVLVGVPQMNIPTFVPGQPSFIPEIPLAKKTDQEGVAKVAVFAFNRRTGNPVWQSGVVQSNSTAKDRWVLGAGPFQQGTIRSGTQFAGEPLNIPTFGLKGDETEAVVSTKVGVTHAAVWQELPTGIGPTKRAATLMSIGSSVEPLQLNAPGTVMPSSGINTGMPFTPPKNEPAKPAKPPAFNPPSVPLVNNGGQDETQPSKIVTAGFSTVATEGSHDGDANPPPAPVVPASAGPATAPPPIIDPLNWYGAKPKR